MKDRSERHRTRAGRHPDTPQSMKIESSEQDSRVGPGRPPKEHQFKPGQSGNPAGARRKPKPIALDIKELLERTLKEEVTLRQGEREKIITKAAAGIQHLVNQFAKGDRYARRDLFALAETLGVDLVAGGAGLEQSVAAALSDNDQALLTIMCGGAPCKPCLQKTSRRAIHPRTPLKTAQSQTQTQLGEPTDETANA
jgi:hypothetical protein